VVLNGRRQQGDRPPERDQLGKLAAIPHQRTGADGVTRPPGKRLVLEIGEGHCPGYCATALNGHRGTRTAAQGADIAVTLATLGDDGPTGGFYDDNGVIAW
jgi:hypothetical protein